MGKSRKNGTSLAFISVVFVLCLFQKRTPSKEKGGTAVDAHFLRYLQSIVCFRAGRCSDGYCFRLFTKVDYNEMDQSQQPELLRTAIHVCFYILTVLHDTVSPCGITVTLYGNSMYVIW